MSFSRKRKIIDEAGKSNVPLCMIHFSVSKNENYVSCQPETFQKLESIKDKRLAEPVGSALRMTDVCLQFPQVFSEQLGYHRDCYQNFTMNLGRLKAWKTEALSSGGSIESISGVSTEKRRRSSFPETVIFKPDCIFCKKEGRKVLKGRV